MLVIYTDLDGTLLDRQDYSFVKAGQALELIREYGIPLIFCSSKTRAEVECWRARLDNHHPFIVENGGALYVPQGYFELMTHALVRRDGYDVFEFGDSYPDLVDALEAASLESGCEVISFHKLSAQEVSGRYGMTPIDAGLAKRREYDEPFEIVGSAAGELLAAIERRKKRYLTGGRLHHILGINDKVDCVKLLTHFYQRAFGSVTTIGLGDGPNDVRFLNEVDFPVLLQSEAACQLLPSIKGASRNDVEGPEGWNAAVMGLVGDFLRGNALRRTGNMLRATGRPKEVTLQTSVSQD